MCKWKLKCDNFFPVLSNESTGYPMLSPQFDESSVFKSFPTSPVSDLSNSVVTQTSVSALLKIELFEME